MNKLKHLGTDNFGFFVKTNNKDYADNSPVKLDYKTWLNSEEGTQEYKLTHKQCWVVSVSPEQLEQFINNSVKIYPYVECVKAPDNSDIDIAQVNKLLGIDPDMEATLKDMKETREKKKSEIVTLKTKAKAKTKTVKRTNNKKSQ